MSRLSAALAFILVAVAAGIPYMVDAASASPRVASVAGPSAVSRPDPVIGPNGYRRTAALDRRYLLGHERWSPCRAVPVKVAGGPAIKHATRRAVANLRRASAIRLRIQAAPLPDGRGIRVRSQAIHDRYTLGRTSLLALPEELWRADIDIDVAKTGRRRLVAIIEHEMGHALGIRHSPRRTGDLMSPVNHGPVAHARWDRAALAYAGQGSCFDR